MPHEFVLNKPYPSMNTTTYATRTRSGNPVMNFIRGWDRFWFTPADPTVLGLIRICCGLVVLYVHLGYTFDLREFVGPNAWADLQAIREYREEMPWVARPPDWSELQPTLPLMTGGVVYTLALEISFPFLVWDRRFRWLMVTGSVLLHTAIALSMGLVPFGLAMLALVFSFLPAEAVHQALARWGGKMHAPPAPTSELPKARAA